MNEDINGTWRIGSSPKNSVFTKDGEFVCTVDNQNNLKLIVAAPDLLDFIQFLAYVGKPETPEDIAWLRNKAFKLIAKAMGKS